MTNYLEYQLQRGYIHNWLVAGPHTIAIEDPSHFDEAQDCKVAIARHYYEAEAGIPMDEAAGATKEGAFKLPVEREEFTVGDSTLAWRYYRCLDDHFVDLSAFYHTWHYLRAWAYAQVVAPAAQQVTLVLTTNGPADVWLNGEHIHRQEHFHHQDPESVAFSASLREGENEILVRFEEVSARECPYVMALEIPQFADQVVTVRVPTYIERIIRRTMYEQAFEYAYLEDVVNYKGAVINLHWAEDLSPRCNFGYSVRGPNDRIYVSGTSEATPGATVDIGHGFRLWERPYRVVLTPHPDEYYRDNTRYRRDIPIYVLDTAYAEEPYGTYATRRQEALEYAAERQDTVFAEIAKMALGKWAEVDVDLIIEAIARINQRADCSDFYLTGLLGVMDRYMDAPAFPEGLKDPLKACVLNFKYWLDEPGTDAMCYLTENHSILFHTCEILAGQRYPDETFTNNGETGRWHREKGERLALGWLRTRSAGGFQEWDSNCYFEEDLLALAHLLDLAEKEEIMEMAAVVIDKMLFTMAVNTYKGAFGSTHGRTYTPLIKGAQLEATSGIGRLMWGTGVFNPHIRGLVALACSEYELPLLIADIATDQSTVLWDRERHTQIALDETGAATLVEGGWEVNKVTYKTPDSMLCSAQDYHPGMRGYQQHIWQATFGPDAVVFVTHPPCMSEEGSRRPNFWHGNYILPRVAQWKDVLVAVHKLPEDDWMGFTHAYFPISAFDDYALRDNWAFARKGDGYIALTSSQDIALITQGPSAYRELRAYGEETVWLCHLGRAAEDGDFEAFQEKILALDVQLEGLEITCETLRGETLTFGWTGPLHIDGEEQPITGFKHYENPYCVADLPASKMDIHVGEYVMRLDFTFDTPVKA